MKVIYFGTPEFAAKTLQYLLDHGVNVAAVITKPDKAKGRSAALIPTPVKLVAQAHHLPVYQPELVSAEHFASTLEQYDADLFVVVAYGEIIKQHLLDMPKAGCINLHASLLPKYRGAAPIQHSIIDGETKTGVTIMHMVKKMDAGDMIKQVEVAIEPNDQFPEIESKLCQAGSEALLEVIQQFAQKTVKATPQDHAHATYAPKIELEDCQINWKLPAQQIHNLVRGVTPDPGAWCIVNIKGEPKRLKIFETRVEELSGTPGEILLYGKSGFVVACGQNSLRLLHLQLEGKKAMSADQLMSGVSKEWLSFTVK